MEEEAPMRKQRNEDLVQAAFEVQDDIRRAYGLHRDHRPIIEFDVVEHRIYAWPYAGYRNCLSERSRALLDKEYRDAETNRQIVVYVKDEELFEESIPIEEALREAVQKALLRHKKLGNPHRGLGGLQGRLDPSRRDRAEGNRGIRRGRSRGWGFLIEKDQQKRRFQGSFMIRAPRAGTSIPR
jgi:hypothetical protein